MSANLEEMCDILVRQGHYKTVEECKLEQPMPTSGGKRKRTRRHRKLTHKRRSTHHKRRTHKRRTHKRRN